MTQVQRRTMVERRPASASRGPVTRDTAASCRLARRPASRAAATRGPVTRARGVVLTALLAVLALLTGCSGSSGAPENAGSEFRFVEGTPSGEVIDKGDRKAAPEVSGELLDGSKYSLQDHDGKIVVINFWASWCAPCRVEAPDLQKTYESYQGDGVELLGVLVRDTKGQGEAYAQQAGLTYPSLFDPSTKVALLFPGYPIAAIPSTIVVDREGKVAAAYVSAVNLDDLTSTIDKLLAE